MATVNTMNKKEAAPIRANGFNTGIAAEYFILSQLYRQGIEAYVSQGNKKAIDIRIVRPDGVAVSLDVKAVRGYSSLVVNNVKPVLGHFVAFVIYNGKFEDVSTYPEAFIVPSIEVPAITKCWKDEKRVMKGSLDTYKDRWDLLLSVGVANNILQQHLKAHALEHDSNTI